MNDKARDQARERQERYRKDKVQVSFTTTEEVRSALRKLAEEQGYSTVRGFMEALALGYLHLCDGDSNDCN